MYRCVHCVYIEREVCGQFKHICVVKEGGGRMLAVSDGIISIHIGGCVRCLNQHAHNAQNG